MTEILVMRQPGRRTFDVVAVVDGKVQAIIEGGFFSRARAERCKRAVLAEQARDAERAAGWDPNP